MTITDAQFQAKLDFLVSIEPSPESVNSSAHYDALMAPHHAAIASANATIRDYGMQIAHEGLPFMQDLLQSYLDLQDDPLAVSVIRAVVNEAWSGCGEWQS